MSHPLENHWTDTPRYHVVAQCRWCHGRFVFVYGEQWVCETDACARRQIAAALRRAEAPSDESPYMFLPLPLQVEGDDSPVKRLATWGPVGISKSFGTRQQLYARCRKIKGYTALLLRSTYDQLYKNHLQFMPAEATKLGDATFKGPGGGKPAQMRFDCDSKIMTGYLQDRGDIAQHMGIEYDEVAVDEANNIITEGLKKVTSRDRGAKESYKTRMAMGLEEGRTRLMLNVGGISWRYIEDFYIEKRPDASEFEHYDPNDYGAITGDIRDNPYLTPRMLTSVLGGLDTALYAQLAHGRRDVFPGQFFENFNPDQHVVSMEPK